MSFLKTKKFWIPFSVVGVGIVAIGTGVGIHQRNQNAINIYEGNSRGEIRTKLRNALNTINANDIRVNLNASGVVRKSLTQTISDSGLYAFNVSSNQLGLSSNVSIPSGIQISFELDKDKNTLQTLNNGVLNIKLVATTPFSDEKQTRDVELNTFKKADEKLSGLVNQNGANSVLEIEINNNSEFITIEELNSNAKITPSSQAASTESISGLNQLLNKAFSKTSEENSNLAIEGKVKLDRIQTIDDKVYFYLTSASSSPLKLVNKQSNNTSETLFKEIRLTNLAASEIVVVPNGYGIYQSSLFSNSLNDGKNLTINLNQTDQQPNNNVELVVKAYLVEQRKTSTKTSVGIQVRFGKDENAKVYDTNKPADFELLKQAGFSFNIFTKKLMNNMQNAKLSDLVKEDKMMKLKMVFKPDAFKKPSAKPSLNGGSDCFKEVMFKLEENKTQAEIDTDTSSMQQVQRSRGKMGMNAMTSTGNFLIFADYKYKGVNNGNMVLLTPTISIVHLNKHLEPLNPSTQQSA